MRRIAIVEDNADNRLLIQALLEDLYEVIEYETGTEALERLEEDNPELVLLDISLPEMDGEEVLARMRSNDKLRGIPVIALTAHAMTGDREHFLESGFDEYIMKPIVDEDVLIDTIAKALKG